MKCTKTELSCLFSGTDRRTTGFIDVSALVECLCPSGREKDRGRDRDRDRERGSRRESREGSRDRERERGSENENDNIRGEKLVLKRNESRVVLRKRPDLLDEIQAQMRSVNKERG